MDEWTRPNLSYAQRVNNLTNGGGLNGNVTLNAQTVYDDGVADMLTGAAGPDWFFVSPQNKLTDRHPSEVATQTFLSAPVTSALHQGRRRGLFDTMEL